MADRCTGHCCQRFFLRYSPAELERAEAARAAGAESWVTDAGETMGILRDIEIIAPMVSYLGPDTAKSVKDVAPGSPGHAYTCRHLQPNGDCAIYDARPGMCRDYPSGVCTFSGCTWDAARGGTLRLVGG